MGSGVTNFLSVVEARSLGTADIDKMSAAIDKQSAALDNLGKKATSVNDHKGFGGFADKVKQGITDPLGSIEQAATKALESLGPAGAIVAGVGAAFVGMSVAGFQAAKSLAAYGQEIENTGLRTGLTTKEVVQFGFAAKLVDQDLSVFQRSMRGLTEALTDNSSAGTKARDALKALGVIPRDLNGELKPTGQLLMELSAALNVIPNALDRNKAGMDIFKRAWIEIAPAMLKLTDGVKIANQQGFFGPNKEQLDQWDKYDAKVTIAEQKLDNLIRRGKEWLAQGLFPDQDLVALRAAKDAAERGGAPTADIAGPSAPGASGLSSVAQSLFGADAARVNQDRAAGNSLLNAARTRIDATLEGLRFKAEQAKQKYEEAYNAIRSLSDVGASAAQKEIDTVSALKASYEGLNEQLKLAEKSESARLAVLEKAQALRNQGQGFLEFFDPVAGPGTNAFFVTEQQITAANTRRPGGLFAPSLFRTPSGRTTGESESIPLGGLTAGAQPNGDFVSPDSQRSTGVLSIEALDAREAGITNKRNAEESTFLGMLRSEADFVGQLVELRAGPGGELGAARTVAAIRAQALQRELDITGDINTFREASQRNEIEFELKLAQLQKQRLDERRALGGQLFDAALGGAGGLRQFATSFLLGQGRTLAGNAFARLTQGISGNLGLGSKVFQGTIFGQDPLKGATDMNTVATVENTRAMMSFASVVAGGGGFSSAAGTFARMAGAGVEGVPETGGIFGSTNGDWAGETNHPAGSFSWGRAAGIGGAALAGGFGIYSGISSGGGRGALTAASSALAMTGTILALSSKALSIAGPIGALAGAGLGLLIPAIFGDPKAEYAKKQEAERMSRAYTAPSGQDYSVDIYGRSFDYDSRGTPRSVTNVYISAMDTQSFHDAVSRNPDAIVTTVAGEVHRGNAELLVGHLQRRLGLQ